MGKFYAGYQLLQVLDNGVGPSKNIWLWDGSRRYFQLDYGAESLRGNTYLNSGPSLAEVTKFIPEKPLEEEDHIPEILAIFAPQLFATNTKYNKLSQAMNKYITSSDMLDFDSVKKPKLLDDFISEVESLCDLRIVSSIDSEARFQSIDGKKWIIYCRRFTQKN